MSFLDETTLNKCFCVCVCVSSLTHNSDVVIQCDEDSFHGSLPSHDSRSRSWTLSTILLLNFTQDEHPIGPSERTDIEWISLDSCFLSCLFSCLDNNYSQTTENERRELHCEAILTHQRHVGRLKLLR